MVFLVVRRCALLWRFFWCLWSRVCVWRCSYICKRVRRIAKRDCQLRHVRPHGASRLPIDGFSLNLIIEYFSRILREDSSFIKIWQAKRVLYMKTNIHFWPYRAQFLEWEMFQTKVAEKIKTYILHPIFFFSRKSHKYVNIVEPDRPQMTIWRMRIACWVTKATNTHSEYVILIAFLLQKWLQERD
jgi:hypothetical protein